jgi:hypothetical protein
MEAILDVQGLAYCTLEIEGSSIPPTMNFIDTIFIQDGFSISVPVLQLILNDSKGTLSGEMNIQDGTLITIKLGKERESAKSRKFRVFSYRKETTAAGPHLVVNAIYDCPKWIAGVFTESFEGTSSDIMGQLVGKAGLQYSGPESTDDKMIWLNVNKTRSAFAEDVAIRGYASDESCMYRILTMDGEVRYKDLFAVLKEQPKFSFLQNVPTDAAEGEPVIVRETQDASVSGFPTHLMNYGKKQYEHSLNEDGQQSTEEAEAPVIGAALPINDDVKGQVSERGARVTYTGWDTGTEPKPASNLHEYYEQAFYQNFRFYGLFSERLVLLSDMYTDAVTFDCVDYKHADQEGQEFVYSKTLAGKWLLGGKTLWIKAGHKYSEMFYLYRAAVMEKGKGSPVGDSSSSPGQPNAAANQGNFNLASNFQSSPNAAGGVGANAPQSGNAASSVPNTASSASNIPGANAARNLLSALSSFGSNSPKIPTKATTSSSITPQQLTDQQLVRESTVAIASTQPPMNTMVHVPEVGDLQDYKVIRRYEPEDVEYVANSAPTAESKVVRSTGLQRISSSGTELKNPIRNIVATPLEGIVGDVASGGLWAQHLIENNIQPDDVITDLDTVVNYRPSALFVQTVDVNSYTRGDVTMSPSQTARNIKDWATTTTPENLLTEQGARTYIDTFGYATPDEVRTLLTELIRLSEEVLSLFAESDALIDNGMDIVESTLTFGASDVSPVVDSVLDVVMQSPVVEISTVRDLVTWAHYFNLGFDGNKWTFPFTFPSEVKSSTQATADLRTAIPTTFNDWIK